MKKITNKNKTITLKITENFYNEIKENCPKDMKISFFYIELLKKGLKR